MKRISPKKINKFIRFIRRVYFRLFDLLGEIIFFFLRLLRFNPSPFPLPTGERIKVRGTLKRKFLYYRVISKLKSFKKDDIKKILIVRLDRIGDVILSTPAIRAVREGFPDAKISLLVREYTQDLVINNTNIDKLLIYGRDSIGSDCDLSIALHPGIRQNYITFISGARYRIGYTGWGGGFFLTHKLIDDRETRIRHEVESALEVVEVVGCTTKDKGLEISVTEEGEGFAEGFFRKNSLSSDDLNVIIHPGARQEYIRWEKEGFASVGDRLIKEENTKVILIGSSDEKKLVEEIASLMKEKPLFAIGLRLTQLISLIKRCSLFIGNSTGPMHIAASLKVPVVAIFGNIHPLDSYQEWGPWGEGHVVVSKNLNCPDCHPTDCRTFDCMKLITTKDVLEAAKKQLNKKL